MQRWVGKERPPLATRLRVLSALLDVVERLVLRHHAARTVAQATVLHVAAHYWSSCGDGLLVGDLLGLGQRLIEAALEAGVALDARDGAGLSALQVAAITCSGMAHLLVDAKADIKCECYRRDVTYEADDVR